MSRYNFETEANFGLDCYECQKEIKHLPCKMICTTDLEGWIYFHFRCYKKFKKREIEGYNEKV